MSVIIQRDHHHQHLMTVKMGVRMSLIARKRSNSGVYLSGQGIAWSPYTYHTILIAIIGVLCHSDNPYNIQDLFTIFALQTSSTPPVSLAGSNFGCPLLPAVFSSDQRNENESEKKEANPPMKANSIICWRVTKVLYFASMHDLNQLVPGEGILIGLSSSSPSSF